MLRSITLFAAAAVCLAALAAGGAKRAVVGRGGFTLNQVVDPSEESHGGPIVVQLDVEEGVGKGYVMVAGDVHDHGHEEGDEVRRGPSVEFPTLYAIAETVQSVKFKGKTATITALGKFNDNPARIVVVVEDAKGKKGEDYVDMKAFSPDGREVAHIQGDMVLGDIKFRKGA